MLQLSVIIPVLQEQQRINRTVAAVRRQASRAEIIVVDGDPAGSTLHVITDPSVIQLTAPAGRGNQLAAGAAVATGDTILMLHADTLLPDHAFCAISSAVGNGAVWGAFRLGIDTPGLAYRIIEHFVDLRCNLFTLPYGDQAIFVTRSVLQQIGGIPLLPLMEDVALCDRLKHSGHRFKLLPTRVQTSARRWQRDGVIRRTLHNWWLLLRYRCGTAPNTLVKDYR
jgi:rSAM/selenodomain-associated transferase 2